MARSATLTVMIKAAEKAARNLKRDFGEVENLQVSRKGPGDFVSIADRKAEEIIQTELAKARPDFSFLMEEGGAVGDQKAENRWIIDPLDGTTNFLHGLPHWAISIAWECRGEIRAGVVYDPIKDEMFFAEKGDGAFLNSRRLRVSVRRDLMASLLTTGVVARHTDTHEVWFRQMQALTPVVGGMRRSGSAALNMAYVAAGRFEGYWENLIQPWDIAAGLLLVTEAGGHVTRLDGRKYALGSHDILATNDALHTTLVRLLRGETAGRTQKAAGQA